MTSSVSFSLQPSGEPSEVMRWGSCSGRDRRLIGWLALVGGRTGRGAQRCPHFRKLSLWRPSGMFPQPPGRRVHIHLPWVLAVFACALAVGPLGGCSGTQWESLRAAAGCQRDKGDSATGAVCSALTKATNWPGFIKKENYIKRNR